MKKAILVIFLLVGLCIGASAQSKVRVKFPRGQSEATVSGSVSRVKYIEYVVRIGRYNAIDVSLSSGSKIVIFTISDPKGKNMDSGIGVREFGGEASMTGDYVIKVYLSENERGTKNFRLHISTYMGT